jgi:hypothetical protein
MADEHACPSLFPDLLGIRGVSSSQPQRPGRPEATLQNFAHPCFCTQRQALLVDSTVDYRRMSGYNARTGLTPLELTRSHMASHLR